MARIVQINSGGPNSRGIELDFEVKQEEWNEYSLLDGGTVRLKTTLLNLYHVVDENDKPKYGDDGKPMIAARHRSDVVTRE